MGNPGLHQQHVANDRTQHHPITKP